MYRFWNAPSVPATAPTYVPTYAPELQPDALAINAGDLDVYTGYSYSGQPPLTGFSSTPFNMAKTTNVVAGGGGNDAAGTYVIMRPDALRTCSSRIKRRVRRGRVGRALRGWFNSRVGCGFVYRSERYVGL